MSPHTSAASAQVISKYAESENERKRHVEAVLNSPAKRKVVVAGPGTGKTFLFKQILKGKQNTLTLTFVNALVEDLSLELYGLSEVRTLHGFARSLLAKVTKKEIKISPRLSGIVSEDSNILLGRSIDFDEIFHNRDDDNPDITFFAKRKQYYDRYGYSDVIFAAVRCLERNKDRIPTYEQVVVDEFQDFNLLEVGLIDLLAETSPVLLAGDDDQALYDFKRASADFIRERHGIARPDYAAFGLPFCSRCTRVIVEATNDIIRTAREGGYLNGRINKDYRYFDHHQKDGESDRSPRLIYNQVYAGQIPWYIQKEIAELASILHDKFSVLIISPTKVQSKAIAESLRNKGFNNVEYVEKHADREALLLEGFRLLLDDSTDNLGWRILVKFLLTTPEILEIVKATDKDPTTRICDLVKQKQRADIKKLLTALKAIRDHKGVKEERIERLSELFELDSNQLIQDLLRVELHAESPVGNAGIRKIPIKATTIQSSKGLSADLVFITHFDDQYFIKNQEKSKIADRDICSFLVALTRAKKRVVLISSTKKDPAFLGWIDPVRIERHI